MKIKDIVKIKGGKRLPKGENLQTIPNQHPYIRVRDMKGKYISLNELEYVPDNVFPQIRNYIVNENDVIISIVGTIGLVSIIDKKLDKASQSENCAKLSGLDYIDAQYLYYYLISDFGQEEIRKVTVGAVQPKLPLYGIENIEIDWKTRNERINIIFILESLDKKIELNTQINQTLEQIAQTIFKSWFIDFDPVHAKANALANGQTAEQATQAAMAVISGKNTQELHRLQTANLEQYQQLWEIAEAFPSGFDEEGVPRGWEERYLKDVCNIVYGKGLPKNKLTEKGFYVFGANGVIGFYDSYTYEKPQVLIGCRGTVGQVTLSYPYSFVTNNSLVIEYENSCVSMYYLEKYLSNINLKEISSGSVQPQITIQNMSKVKILIPNIEILNFYSEKVKEIYDKRLHHFYENQSLSKVRDLLLPKLLSGEV
ncbi:restriction endonuclease subunit S [Glaesserella parasuis]|uniref:restriction endonuclease subunit S n=1 Tax=Glaesserella parasuis TaxID=738 RepID=UPI00135DDBE8|nr:restriction endonuclease subunit S [Glaesserella parasuis]MWQ46990.1 restriction endonuclease subunit S [Glaesserella parasuis]